MAKSFTDDSLFNENAHGDEELSESFSVVDKDLLDPIDEEDGELTENRMMEAGDNDIIPLDENGDPLL